MGIGDSHSVRVCICREAGTDARPFAILVDVTFGRAFPMIFPSFDDAAGFADWARHKKIQLWHLSERELIDICDDWRRSLKGKPREQPKEPS